MNEKLFQRICQISEISKFREDFNQHAKEMATFKDEIAMYLVCQREVQQLKVENARLKKKISAGVQFAELHDLISTLKIGATDNCDHSTEDEAARSRAPTTIKSEFQFSTSSQMDSVFYGPVPEAPPNCLDVPSPDDDGSKEQNEFVFGAHSNGHTHCNTESGTPHGVDEQDSKENMMRQQCRESVVAEVAVDSKEEDLVEDEETKHDLYATRSG